MTRASSVLLSALLITALGVAACGGDSSPAPAPSPSPSPAPSPAPAPGLTVSIVNGATSRTTTAFAPNPLTVAVGSTVTWVNNDVTIHDATADNRAFATGPISPGGSASVTLQAAGQVSYTCTIHPGMIGVITVQ